MTTAILCTDGSDPAIAALTRGLALLAPGTTPLVVTVVDEPDESLVTGSGMAGGTMSPADFDAMRAATSAEGERVIATTSEALGLAAPETRVLQGHAGRALCTLAEEIGADVIVMGSRGRGGIKRAVLGSVSDHVVRNAPCSVLVTRDA